MFLAVKQGTYRKITEMLEKQSPRQIKKSEKGNWSWATMELGCPRENENPLPLEYRRTGGRLLSRWVGVDGPIWSV